MKKLFAAAATLLMLGGVVNADRIRPPGASDSSKRQYLSPTVRAATDCLTTLAAKKGVRRDDPKGLIALQKLAPALIRDESCAANIRILTRDYDSLFGQGAGAAFVRGPYLADLPRAISARLKERVGQANETSQPPPKADRPAQADRDSPECIRIQRNVREALVVSNNPDPKQLLDAIGPQLSQRAITREQIRNCDPQMDLVLEKIAQCVRGNDSKCTFTKEEVDEMNKFVRNPKTSATNQYQQDEARAKASTAEAERVIREVGRIVIPPGVYPYPQYQQVTFNKPWGIDRSRQFYRPDPNRAGIQVTVTSMSAKKNYIEIVRERVFFRDLNVDAIEYDEASETLKIGCLSKTANNGYGCILMDWYPDHRLDNRPSDVNAFTFYPALELAIHKEHALRIIEAFRVLINSSIAAW